MQVRVTEFRMRKEDVSAILLILKAIKSRLERYRSRSLLNLCIIKWENSAYKSANSSSELSRHPLKKGEWLIAITNQTKVARGPNDRPPRKERKNGQYIERDAILIQSRCPLICRRVLVSVLSQIRQPQGHRAAPPYYTNRVIWPFHRIPVFNDDW